MKEVHEFAWFPLPYPPHFPFVLCLFSWRLALFLLIEAALGSFSAEDWKYKCIEWMDWWIIINITSLFPTVNGAVIELEEVCLCSLIACLKNRKQRVGIHGQLSPWMDVRSGVPCNLFKNDPEQVVNCMMVWFPDETKLFRQVKAKGIKGSSKPDD